MKRRTRIELAEQAATLRRIARDLEEEAAELRGRPSWAYSSIHEQAKMLYDEGMTDLVVVINKRHQTNLVAQTAEYLNWGTGSNMGVLESIATDYGDVTVFYTREDLDVPLVYGRNM